MAEKKRYFVLELQGSDSSWSVEAMAMAIFVLPVKFSSGGTREFSLQVTTLYIVTTYMHPFWSLFH